MKGSWKTESKKRTSPYRIINIYGGTVLNTQENFLLRKEAGPNIELKDDIELLDLMLTDSKKQPPLYSSGSTWNRTARKSVKDIKRCGISEFRGSTNTVGQRFADPLIMDARNDYHYGFKYILQGVTRIYPLSRLYGHQVLLTEAFANLNNVNVQEIINIKEKNRNLLKKYNVPFSLLGNCLRKVKINGHDYSSHYLDLLEQHDNIATRINFKEAYSVFEIGGGFGANIHLLLENYKNIRKVLYLDIPPTLYVGTQYLKAFYGNRVFDYRSLKHSNSIKFTADDNLEIFCITPWQIEEFQSAIDVLMNSHSFVEIPKNIVDNYVRKFEGFPESINSAVSLTTYDAYDGFNLDRTFHPNELPKFFNGRKFDYFEVDTIYSSSRKNLFFVSPGKLSF
jgi:putative sugar O-methyltransferase